MGFNSDEGADISLADLETELGVTPCYKRSNEDPVLQHKDKGLKSLSQLTL